MKREEFDRLVSEAIKELPLYFRRYLKNVEIAVRDLPTDEIVERTRKSKGEVVSLLLGVFIGVPRPLKQPSFTSISFPDRIELYQKNIESMAKTCEEIKAQIQATIKHEIGHFFGLDEETIRKILSQ
ncbi:MAG: metallopeptidase family protein [Candidatus Edwardsbacteria bacterium]